jgi:hypothetical protein
MIAALIAPLLAQGLNLLSNAALAKGKDWIEEKTGVSLDQPLSQEDITKLRQYELEHEEELLRIRLEENKLSLDEFRIEVDDRKSARERDAAYIKAGTHNYRADLMFLLAVCMIAGMVYIVWQDQGINEYVKGIFTLVLGRFLGYLDNIYNFEFGTTRSSRSKDETISKLSGGKQ